MCQAHRWSLSAAAIVWAVLAAGSLQADPAPSPGNALGDACLRSVWFVDPDRGWAVGDRGVIWRTVDGGRQWQLQTSGVACRLDDIFFGDATTGWIVGGWTHPHSHETSGVVLRTLDGGETWVRVPGLVLPALHKVRFFTPRDGVAIGTASAMYPAGIFRSTDGGRSWTTMPPGPWAELTAGDFVDAQKGALASRDGNLSVVSYSRLAPSRTPSVGARRIRSLVLQGDTGWLVGDGGLVMRTDTAGATWELQTGLLPQGNLALFDFHTVSAVGDACWIAGSPGSIVFHSPDRGRTWQRFSTGRSLPIEGLRFADPHRGWAVGALGSILGTRDGGRTWWPLRGGGERVALLGLLGDPRATPWECLAWCSGNEGYLSAVAYLNRRDLEAGAAEDSPAESRVEEAVVAAGGSAAQVAWSFPVRQRGLQPKPDFVASVWDRANDGDGKARLREYMVRQIRMWRPDVVVTEEASPDGKHVVEHEINQAALQAIEEAADPTAHPDLIATGLPPWRVQKVFSRTMDGSSNVRISTSQLAANLGVALDDFVAHSRGLMSTGLMSPPEQWEFRILVNRIPQDVGFHDIFSGLHLPPGGGARREPGAPPVSNLEALSRMVQKRRNVERMVAKSTKVGGNSIGWVGQLEDLTSGFPQHIAASVLYQLAMRYEREGQAELAANTLQRLISTCPDHELSETSLIWLVTYYASGEASWLARSATSFRTEVVQASTAEAEAALGAGGASVAKANYQQSESTAAPHLAPAVRSRQAVEYASLAGRTRPALYARPDLRFPAASAQRQIGQARDGEAYIDLLAASGGDPTWQACAQTEQWLRHGRGMPPKPVALCTRTSLRPHLDGDLSDAVWQNAKPLELHSPMYDDAGWPASVMLAYDQEYLYLAATVHRAPHESYPKSNALRQRDPRQQELDRIELCLDIDRDYASFYKLTIDHRGWAAESLLGNTQWNPQWFIAQRESAESWTVEAAIPFAELTGSPPVAKTAWAVQVQRVAPHSGFQSWSTPAAVETIPRGFGLMLFQE